MTDAFNIAEIPFETNEPRDIFADKAGFEASQDYNPGATQDVPELEVQLSPQDTRAVAIQILLQNASIRGVGYDNAERLIAEAQTVTSYLATGEAPLAGADRAGTDAQTDLG